MSKSYRLAALPGEGVGPEVVDAALRVLDALSGPFSVSVQHALIGPPAFAATGNHFPPETERVCAESDGILFGAVSKGGLLELRRCFDLYVNLRPVRVYPGLAHKSSLKTDKVTGLDLLFVRELVSGIYFGPSGRDTDEGGDYGFHTMKYYDHEIRRIARFALGQARARRGLVTVAHKENALPHLPWSKLVQEEARDFPEVTVEPMLVDNLAMQLVREPKRFDVILAGNLFGDILSDIGGALSGSIGLLGSASLNAKGFGMYEPVHGTAPDIAGKGIVNPMGALNSLELMLAQWGETDAAERLSQACDRVLGEGYRTADLSPGPEETLVDCNTFTQLIIDHL